MEIRKIHTYPSTVKLQGKHIKTTFATSHEEKRHKFRSEKREKTSRISLPFAKYAPHTGNNAHSDDHFLLQNTSENARPVFCDTSRKICTVFFEEKTTIKD